MTIEKQSRDEFAVSCDHCSNVEFIFGDFSEVISQIKRDGWKVSKVDDEWQHTCPCCVDEDEALE